MSRRFHCIHAMDFEKLGNPYDDLMGWNALVHAIQFLEEKGILFASAYRKKYVFDAAVREWLHPYQFSPDAPPLQSQPGAEVTVGCTNLGHFWRSTIYDIGALVKRQAGKIHIEYIKPEVKSDEGMLDESGWVMNNIHTIQRLAQHVLAPKIQTQIDFAVQKSDPKNRYDLMILGDQFIDQKVLERYFPMVKPGGAMIVNPDDCWIKIDLFRGDYAKNS